MAPRETPASKSTMLNRLWLGLLAVALFGNFLIIFHAETLEMPDVGVQYPDFPDYRPRSLDALPDRDFSKQLSQAKSKNKKKKKSATLNLRKEPRLAKATETENTTTKKVKYDQQQIQILKPKPKPINEKQPSDFSICLLTKDDGDILPEWIAYHYHALGLRHLVVAVDPSSKQKPKLLFDKFRKLLPELTIDEWHDQHFMPAFFLNKTYSMVPNFMGRDIQNMTFGEWCTTNKVRPVIVKDMTVINNHRYRQSKFVSECTQHLLRQNTSIRWMSPLDSDEYIVVNPELVVDRNWSDTSNDHKSKPWKYMEPSSVLTFLQEFLSHLKNPTTCVQVPRLLFGSIQDGSSSQDPNPKIPRVAHFNSTLLSTLNWKYYAAYPDEHNHLQKVILDLTKVPEGDELFGDHAYSVHRPSRALCAPEIFGATQLLNTTEIPLAANHYLGSWEQYSARPDKRRSRKVRTVS